MNLFAYGTLMAPEGLRQALGDRAATLRLRPARLGGWRRVWNVYREEWKGGVLNVEPAPGETIVGVLVEGLAAEDFERLDQQEATHLPRETVYVEPFGSEAVAAQLYRRRQGNHNGRPAQRYRDLVKQRAFLAGWEVFDNLCRGSVDASGRPLQLE
jgi:hypothetical protein